MQDKIYCGNARIRKTNFGDQTQISLSRDDVKKITDHMNAESLTWVNINIKEKRDVIQGRPTHYLEVDQWKPDPNFKKDEAKEVVIKDTSKVDDNLPF